MAWKGLNLLELRFAALVRQVRDAERERQEAISAGRIHDADRLFLEYAAKITRGENLAQELGYREYDAAARSVERKSLR
jgi:hypothetical protein